jgi:ribosomal protein L21E
MYYEVGQKVRVVMLDLSITDWENPGTRVKGATGHIIRVSNAHGLCYQVRHGFNGYLPACIQGSLGWYEPHELELI